MDNNELEAIIALESMKTGRIKEIKDANELNEANEEEEEYYDSNSSIPKESFLENIKKNAVDIYKQNKPTIKYGMEATILPMVNIIEKKHGEWKRKRRLTKANSMFPENIKLDKAVIKRSSVGCCSGEDSNNNSTKQQRLTICLKLLILANNQITNKAKSLQIYDKKDDNAVIINEIISIIKKVVSLISKYTGNSISTEIRETLREIILKLPIKWNKLSNNKNKLIIIANDSIKFISNLIALINQSLNSDLSLMKKEK